MPTAKRNPHTVSASIQCQKCGRELRENFLVYDGESALESLKEFAAVVHRWTIAVDMTLCHLCASGKGPKP